MRNRSVLVKEGEVSFRPFASRFLPVFMLVLFLPSFANDLSQEGRFQLTCRWQEGAPHCRQSERRLGGLVRSSEDLGQLHDVMLLSYPQEQRSVLRLITERDLVILQQTIERGEQREREIEQFIARDPGHPLELAWEQPFPDLSTFLQSVALFLLFLGMALWRSTRYVVTRSPQGDMLTVRHSLWGIPLSRWNLSLQAGARAEVEQPGAFTPPPDKVFWIRSSRKTYRLVLVSGDARTPLIRWRHTQQDTLEKAAQEINRLLSPLDDQAPSSERAA